ATFSVSSPPAVSHGGSATLTVTRGGDLTGQVIVKYATGDRSAHAGTDYTATNGTLTFAPNQTTQTITVATKPTTAATPAEQFTVVLSDADGGTISQGTGTVSIAPHTIPTISISGAEVNAANATTAVLTVSLSAASDT